MARVNKHICIVGAGLTGATIAHELATKWGWEVDLYDSRSHVAGNCHTSRNKHGVLIHRYGPHIFHTNNDDVAQFMHQFGTWYPYEHRVKTVYDGHVYSMPINLQTICQLYGKVMSVEEARQVVARDIISYPDPSNLEEHALASVGTRLYEAFIEGYTTKQWGRHPATLPASVIKRLPVRWTMDDRYFSDKHQMMPLYGYTRIVESMLASHRNIHTWLNTSVVADDFDDGLVCWTGPVDAYFGYKHGRLEYRTLDFRHRSSPNSQGAPVINYAEGSTPFTRTTEHALFQPTEQHEISTITSETSRAAELGDTLYYPVRLAESSTVIEAYEKEARQSSTIFAGRLGTYRYLDMAPCVEEAIQIANQIGTTTS